MKQARHTDCILYEFMIPLAQDIEKRWIPRDRKEISGAKSWGKGRGSNCPLGTAFPFGVMHKRMTFTESELDLKFYKWVAQTQVPWGGQMKEGATRAGHHWGEGSTPMGVHPGGSRPRRWPLWPHAWGSHHTWQAQDLQSGRPSPLGCLHGNLLFGFESPFLLKNRGGKCWQVRKLEM